MEYEGFLRRLKACRKARKLTLDDVAKQLSITPSLLSMWENNETPLRIKDYLVLCKIYQLSADELFCEGKEAELYILNQQIKRLEERDFEIIKKLIIFMLCSKEENTPKKLR